MDGYEFDCVNYSDAADREMYWGWRCLRKLYLGRGVGRFRPDRRRIRLARKVYEQAKALARAQGGKVGLLIDHGLGLCQVCLENVHYLQSGGKGRSACVLALLSRADGFTITQGIREGLSVKLSFQAFAPIQSGT